MIQSLRMILIDIDATIDTITTIILTKMVIFLTLLLTGFYRSLK